jgi:ribosomal protein S18 acetylase RimI-like enzyme
MNTSQPFVRKARTEEATLLAGVLARAFADDAMTLHMLRDPDRRQSDAQRMFETILRHVYLPERETYTNSDVSAVALWLPPGRYPAPIVRQLRAAMGFLRILGLRGPHALRSLAQMERMHPKNIPHWYLSFIGVEPSAQQKGVGTALLTTVLERCDTGRKPAWLETTNERNLPFYERHGFRVVAECDLSNDGPHFWGMWREVA